MERSLATSGPGRRRCGARAAERLRLVECPGRSSQESEGGQELHACGRCWMLVDMARAGASARQEVAPPRTAERRRRRAAAPLFTSCGNIYY